MQPRVEIVSFDAGGGHRAAAAALQQVLHAQQRPWQVREHNLFALLDPAQRSHRLFGGPPESLYNRRLAAGRTAGMGWQLRALQALIRAAHAPLVNRLAAHWRASAPDLVVSVIPNFNRAMADALARARPGVPLLTVMTDIADCPPRFWVAPAAANQRIVCGSAHALAQARAQGVPEARLHRASGMLLRPDFYDARHALTPAARAAARERCGLDAHRRTVLVMFGGQGSPQMLALARALPEVQLVMLCGANTALREALATLPADTRCAPLLALGHTPDVAHWMALADAFVGKPGPGALSEAVQMGLPVVTVVDAATMPQERWNGAWVREQGLGRVAASWAEAPAAVRALLAALPDYRAAVAAQRNRALYELPEIMAACLHERPAPDPDPALHPLPA